jgi:hypothetical protein
MKISVKNRHQAAAAKAASRSIAGGNIAARLSATLRAARACAAATRRARRRLLRAQQIIGRSLLHNGKRVTRGGRGGIA